MRVIRSSVRPGLVLGAALLSALSLTSSNTARAATFPTHVYFWSDNLLPPEGYIPRTDWSFCKNDLSIGCTINIGRNTSGWVEFRNFYELNVFNSSGTHKKIPFDSLIFATPYGHDASDSRTAFPPRYCTSGGTMAEGFINCSKATQMSVRIVGLVLDDWANPISVGWPRLGSSGRAAYGSFDANALKVSFNSSSRYNKVTALGGGVYKVTIPDDVEQRAISGTIAHVQAVQPDVGVPSPYEQKRLCTIFSLTKRSGADPAAAEMLVRCYGRHEPDATTGMIGSTTLSAMNAPFNFIYEAPGGSLIKSVWSDVVSSTANFSYRPANSSDPGITVTRTNKGRYTVFLPNSQATKTNVQVTAQGSGPLFCNVEDWLASGTATNVRVSCFAMTADGAVPTDSQFHLGYYFEKSEL